MIIWWAGDHQQPQRTLSIILPRPWPADDDDDAANDDDSDDH